MMSSDVAKKWFEVSYTWLKKCGPGTQLRETTRQIVEQMHETVGMENYAAAAYFMERLRDLSDRLSVNQTGQLRLPYEKAEIRMECGRAAYFMDDHLAAIDLFRESSSHYTGNNHCKAVVLWMLGCIQWQLSTRINDAILSWEESCGLFKDLEQRSNQPEIARWYEYWHLNMHHALERAICNDFVFPPPPEEWVGKPDSSTASKGNHKNSTLYNAQYSHNPDHENNGRNMAVLRSFSVYASIPAGGFAALPQPDGWMEIERVNVGNSPHYVVSLQGGHTVTLVDTVRYVAVKVKGDSMNKRNIIEGDYVLLRIQGVPENGDIVIVELDGNIPDDEKSTLKQFFRRDGRIELVPQSENPKHKPFIFAENDPALHVRGVAIAVLKQNK